MERKEKMFVSYIKENIKEKRFANVYTLGAIMKPKTLQTIWGHSTLDKPMNKYVHTIDDEQFQELERVEHILSSVV